MRSLNIVEANITNHRALIMQNTNNQNKVFLVDTNRQPLNPITPKQARKLLEKGKAAVLRQFPFTLILKTAVENPTIYPLTLKIDPGSKVTGIAILSGDVVIWAAELEHRGQSIKNDLESRKASRNSRRARKTRYRKPRFDNRKRTLCWIPPSLLHRVQTTQTWVNRLIRFSPIKEIYLERVKFDLTKMQNPEVSGIEYCQGELVGYEIREYMLEKWNRQCFYCGAKNVPLQIEHIIPKSKGGSNRASNLTLACECCNQKKADQDVEQFLKGKPKKLHLLKEQAKKPLKDATAVNATRNKLLNTLKDILPVTTGSGAQTKMNRIRLNLRKEHWIDAACVGEVSNIILGTDQPLLIKSTGQGNRQYANVNKFGFPKSHKTGEKTFFGFTTGDIVQAFVTQGKKVGNYIGRVAVRKTGSFNITTNTDKIQGISHKYCRIIHRCDGYSYSF